MTESHQANVSDRPLTKVLLADDDAEMRRILAKALSDEGYLVVEATNGADLLAKLDFAFCDDNAIATVDVIVTDVRMPGVTGFEVLEGLRQVDWATPVILISAFADDQLVRDARLFGVTAVLPKPFALRDLLDAVSSAAPARR
jgi:CheY-like chemotaxis protein